jgi:hypothetical protein
LLTPCRQHTTSVDATEVQHRMHCSSLIARFVALLRYHNAIMTELLYCLKQHSTSSPIALLVALLRYHYGASMSVTVTASEASEISALSPL